MNPIKRKVNYYFFGIVSIALVVSLISILINPYNAIVAFIALLYCFDNRHRIKPALVKVSFYLIFSYPFIIFAEYFLFGLIMQKDYPAPIRFIISTVSALLLIMAPYYYLSRYFLKVLIAANFEKDNYDIISKYPYLICKEHHTRTKQFSVLGFKSTHCRLGTDCLKNKQITKAINLVGVIGDSVKNKENEHNYYVTLWDNGPGEIRYGDYDIIEIHENKSIDDYDFIIAKVITYFNNEIDRFKPINEVKIRIAGNPGISENTIRVLKRHFAGVEYLEL